MDIKTLESFKLSDAVKFHDKLNPRLWLGNRLDPAVKKQLLLIAEDFIEELGIGSLDIEDITVSGSNAAYSYTPHSDLDLHILVDMDKLPANEVYRELFTAKKNLYNDSHDITVHGVPVELYVQDSNEPVVSLGEYSLLQNKWLKLPTKRRANLDQNATKAKFERLKELIEVALKSKNIDKVTKVLATIKRYRKAGLDKGGEFSPENLAFKVARKQGWIQKLYDLRNKLHSEELTIETMYKANNDLAERYAKEFEDYDVGVAESKNDKKTFKMKKGKNSFGVEMYINDKPVGSYQYNNTTNRHLAQVDAEYRGKGLGKLLVLKALETANKLGMDFIEDESRTAEYDNVIDSLENLGYVVSDDGQLYLTQDGLDYLKSNLQESASGYIPSKKQANDPRFKTALTVDIKPDSIMKNAKAFGSKVSRAGIPPQARPDGKIG